MISERSSLLNVVEGILSWIRDQRTKMVGSKKSFETRKVAYTCKYTSKYLLYIQ